MSSDPGRTDDADTPKPRRGFRVAAVLGGLIAALLVAEVVFRVGRGLGAPAIGSRMLLDTTDPTVRYQCFPTNPDGAFGPVPPVVAGQHRLFRWLDKPEEIPLDRLDETPWCVDYAVPMEGLRGEAPSAYPAAGVQRIAVVGDSFVFGNGVQRGGTLSAHLQALLGDGHEVVNCGRPGANIDGHVENADLIRDRFHSSKTLVVVIVNDMPLGPSLEARMDKVYDLIVVVPEYVHGKDARPWWARASALASAAVSARRMRRVTDETLAAYRDAHDPGVNPEGIAAARSAFEELAESGTDDVAIVLFPLMMPRAGGVYPLQSSHDTWSRLAREAGLPVLDLADAFKGIDWRELRVHEVDHHPNGRAHGIAAERVAAWLRTDVSWFLEGE